ncbi:hypothetical protein ACFC8N_43465 [Streptomyces sp. NPDC055966]|uniref:hypothetical protein n=1 Tax=Streptomyces sp. NPDC055966 TaxID=3345669 RepID=UPI0035D77FF2
MPTSTGCSRTKQPGPPGKLRIDNTRIKSEENLDVKYLVRCSDPHLSAEAIALGYERILEVECGWRDMKQMTDQRRLPPARRTHPRPRIPLLARPHPHPHRRDPGRDDLDQTHRELQRLHARTFTGTFHQVTGLTKPRRDLLAKLGLPHLKQGLDLQPAPH